jgi:hypothetical protein
MTAASIGSHSRPAASIGELLRYLEDAHSPEFVYRGQVCAWPGPLLPSAFRCYTRTGQILEHDGVLPCSPLRGSGQVFCEVEPLNQFAEFADSACQVRLSFPELMAIERLVDDFEVSVAISGGGAAALVAHVPPALRARFEANRAAWKAVFDYVHRNRVRQLVCLNGFGYVLGMALAQHYGFSSEALDVSHDPKVAAFFATRLPPRYTDVADSGVGVIVRFRLRADEISQIHWEQKDFYTAPGYIAIGPILAASSAPAAGHSACVGNLFDHVMLALEAGKAGRRAHRIMIDAAALRNSRIVRQGAALLIPDLLLEEKELAQMHVRTFMAVEDLRSRPGTEEFYFQHGPASRTTSDLTREWLWPQEDAFADMFRAVLHQSAPYVIHPTGMVLPKRPDLVDAGYLP